MAGPAAGCLAPEAALGFVAGGLDADAAEAVEEHLDGCADCRSLVAALARARDGDRAADPTDGLAATDPASPLAEVDLLAPDRSGRDAGHPPAGTRIDRYVIDRPLGAGGMGAVSLADDPELRRKVCLKLLRPELFDPGETQATRARLLREAQAMAQVSHPNVVSVFDIGTHEGQVFIAMEYIPGWDLAQWLRLEPRAPGEVLEVFRAAGRGLAAAHRAGLVHRDFKPQNVLIGADGAVKVADFGLARAAVLAARRSGALAAARPDGDPADQARPGERDDRRGRASRRLRARGEAGLLDSPLTRAGALVGTPAYMAPEQVSGDAVDARCDQFAFAVALHEALSGERPFPGGSLTEIFTATVEGRGRPLPRRAGASRRVRAAIARGLRARPADRFPTMDALLGELAERGPRRLLLGAAALAAGGGAVVAVMLLARGDRPAAGPCDGGEALVAAVWGPAARQRVEAALAGTGLPLAASSSSLIATELDRYAAGWAAAHREACAATRERGAETEERMALRMSCLERRRAELAQAVDVLEHPDARLVDTAFLLPANLSPVEDCADPAQLAGPALLPRDPARRERAAAVRARLARAKVLATAQRFDQARATAEPAAREADEMGWMPLVAEARLSAATIDMQQARHADAEAAYHAAALAAEESGHDRIRAEAYLGLVELAQIRSQYVDAERWAGHARALIERIGAAPALAGKLAVLLGDVHADKGDKASAIAQYRTAIAILARDGRQGESDAAWARFRLGNYYFRTREFDRAIEELEATAATWRALGGDDHPLALLALQTMADTRREQGRPADALPLAERAVAAYRRVYGDEHESTAGAYSTLGMVLTSLGRVDQGLARQERALAIYRRALGPRHIYVAGHLGTIARTLVDAGRFDDAAARASEAIAIATEQGASGALIVYRNLLGTIHTRASRYDAAIVELEGALAAAEELLAPDAAQLADTLTRLGTARLRKGQPARAADTLERALAIRAAGKASPWESSWTKLELARALWDARRDRRRALTLANESRVEAEAAADAAQARDAAIWLAAHAAVYPPPSE